jgi:hypothetical protein
LYLKTANRFTPDLPSAMSQIELRDELHQLIDQVDEGFLKAIHHLLLAYQQREQPDAIIGYDTAGKPLYAKEALTTYARRLEAMRQGQEVDLEAFKALHQ